jgi:hypothetical protein
VDGGAAKKGVDGRSVSVLSGTLAHADGFPADEEVGITRAQVDVTGNERFTILGHVNGQGRGSGQDALERAARGRGGYVEHHEHGGTQIVGEPLDHPLQGLDPTGGGTRDDHFGVGALRLRIRHSTPSSSVIGLSAG